MKYKHDRTGREMEVGEHERVRRQVLERSGWLLVEETIIVSTVTPEESPAVVTTTIQGRDDFTQLKGVSEELATALYGVVGTFAELANADTKQLTTIQGIGEKKAASLIKQAKELNEQ